MMCTNMTTILSHQEDLGPSMLDVKYEGLGGTGLVTTPLNMAPNLSECNVSHGGIALRFFFLLKIFDVSKMAILKCPSVTSRRDKFGHDIKIDIFFRKLWVHG